MGIINTLGCFFWSGGSSLFLVKAGDKFGDIVNFNFLLLSLCISEIMKARGAFREQGFSSCPLDNLTSL